MFYTQIVNYGGIPFELKIPNQETIDAINENVDHMQEFDSVEDMMNHLHHSYE